MRFIFILAAMWLALAVATKAQDYDAGLDAYFAGDFAAALAEWRPLADQGHADAQIGLGLMYEYGYGVSQNVTQAVRWYRLAAEQGDPGGQYNLGRFYSEGKGVPQSDAEAVRLYRSAAEQGMPHAQYSLGKMYEHGKGVSQDYVSAYMWLSLSNEWRGDIRWLRMSDEWRDSLATKMMPEQIAEAQSRASTCFESGYTDCD